MYKNTFSTSVDYYKTSTLQEDEEVSRARDEVKKVETANNVFDYGYLYSIVLKRESIMNGLTDFFEIDQSAVEELDFLAANLDILELLPSIGLHIHNRLDSNAKLSLELLSEGSDWQTLFININTKCDWEASDAFVNRIYEILFEEFTQIADKLNVNIIPNEL